MDYSDHPLSGQVMYQIYPRSFRDTNNDGIGDLRGIIDKLDHLKGGDNSLDIDVLWISPFYPSPMADFGYDVKDYCDIDPMFGNLDDFKELLDKAHQRGIKLFIDFIPNHTSDEHEWFKESRSSRDNPKQGWYVWRDPNYDGSAPPYPNNWESVFGGPAWTYDETRHQYYLHSFLNRQPDLNWEVPEVRAAMQDQMKFWLDMGVDGFRVDAVTWIAKDPDLRDEVYDRENGNAVLTPGGPNSKNGPRLYEYLHVMADTIKEYDNRFMVLEAYPAQWDDMEAYANFYKYVDPKVCAPFSFVWNHVTWDAKSLENYTEMFIKMMKPEYLPIFCLGNHDQSRIATKAGERLTRLAATLLLTVPGMPSIYYGDEIGMTDKIIEPHQVMDPFEKNLPNEGFGRDPERTPMQWDDSEGAGFSDAKPWLPLGDNKNVNVAQQISDDDSLLNLYRKLIEVRKKSKALTRGSFEVIANGDNTFSYVRHFEDESVLIMLNFSQKMQIIKQPILEGAKIILATDPKIIKGKDSYAIPAHQAVIVEIKY
jgi:alpha-glucosidase